VSKEGNMPKYVLDYAGLREFESATPSGVMDILRTIMKYDNADIDGLLSTCASNICDQVYEPIRFGTVGEFTEDLMKHNVIREISQ
jgi:hypothetical protein|tara:strand:- start:241 stop:498 length:258 start_codon:yes stop_codon:yes gene_type:complete